MRLIASLSLAACLIAPVLIAGPALAQPADATALMAAQREAMKPLAWMQGRWSGEALATTPAGQHKLLQTERAGPMLGGTVMVVEGKGFDPVSKAEGFNAMGIISYDPTAKAYTFTRFAQGRRGVFPMEVTVDGFAWSIPAGPMKLRYVATYAAGTWKETGEMIRPDGVATPMFEMTVRRVGNSDWPAAGGAVAP